MACYSSPGRRKCLIAQPLQLPIPAPGTAFFNDFLLGHPKRRLPSLRPEEPALSPVSSPAVWVQPNSTGPSGMWPPGSLQERILDSDVHLPSPWVEGDFRGHRVLPHDKHPKGGTKYQMRPKFPPSILTRVPRYGFEETAAVM